MSRSMQNLLREFRTLYEERLQRLDMSPNSRSPQNVKARCEVYQHYVHDLLEQNDALINALKDSEVKLETSGEMETSLINEIGLAKGFEEQLFCAREERTQLEIELETIQHQANSLREQLDESDATKDRLESAVGDAHRDVARMRLEMNELREKMRLNERHANHSDEDISKLKRELEIEHNENNKLTNAKASLDRQLELVRAESSAACSRVSLLESELNEKMIESASLERELISYRIGRDTSAEKVQVDKTQKIILAAKVNELEKELRPLREEIGQKTDKLSREKDLSFELASSVARLKDQVKQQMENYKSMDSQNKDNTRKLKEAKDDVESLDRRRQTLTTENQKLRELLHEAQIDRQKLKEDVTISGGELEAFARANKDKVRSLESKLERRTKESSDLADRITKLNLTISTLRAAEKAAKDQNNLLNDEILDQKRKLTDSVTSGKNKEDKIGLLESQVHDRDVELECIRSSLNNKSAESEENLLKISKQEQLVHELSTELSSKNGELRRLQKEIEDFQSMIQDLEEKIQHQNLKLQTQEEVIIIARGEIEDYERMKPRPESEVITLQGQLDQTKMENESMRIKLIDGNRRITDTSQLCNDLRNKLKAAVKQRDQSQQVANLYETKFTTAERQLKDLEFTVLQAKNEIDREKEISSTRTDAFESRLKDMENAKNSAEGLYHVMQKELQVTKMDNNNMTRSVEKESDKVQIMEKELLLQSNETERLSQRVNVQREENIKLSKLVEELTASCEQFNRQKRESDALLRNIRGELGMASKARKASEAQFEAYRSSIKQLEDNCQAQRVEIERLNDELRAKQTDEVAFKTKKRELKGSVTELTDSKRTLEHSLEQAMRIGNEQKNRIKSLEDALRMIRRETETSHCRLKNENDKIRKKFDKQTSEYSRKISEYDSRSSRQHDEINRLSELINRLQAELSTSQSEICRLTDVIDKLQAELTTSKSQLSQLQRLEDQSRSEMTTIRETHKNKEMRARDIQAELDSLQRENSRQMAEMARHIKEKDMTMVEEEKLRHYSTKQQVLIQELRRKLAAKTDLQVHYQPQMYGDFASTQ